MKNGVHICWFFRVKFLTNVSRRCWDSHTPQHQASSAVLVQAIQDILHTGLYIVHVTVGQHTVLVNQLEIKPKPNIQHSCQYIHQHLSQQCKCAVVLLDWILVIIISSYLQIFIFLLTKIFYNLNYIFLFSGQYKKSK